MGFLNGLRLSGRRLLRHHGFRKLVLVLAVYTFLDALRIQRVITGAPRHDPARPRRAERVYVAGMHYNSAHIIRSHWSGAVLELAEALGRDNVFVSVYESGSWDGTKEALAELDEELGRRGVRRSVVLDERTHEQEVAEGVAALAEGGEGAEGWIVTPRGRREMRRIPFLAKLRNLTLRDLWRLSEEGEVFDKVLFLNDVVFSTEDVLALLDTNGGVYAAACSLDFSQPPYYYDTFALRDSSGQAHLMQTWPYFRSRRSREALMAYSDAVPVRSCWNGIVAMQAAPFLAPEEKKKQREPTGLNNDDDDDGREGPPVPGLESGLGLGLGLGLGRGRLKFRAVPDSLAEDHHLEASECCLIHVDNPLSQALGVYLNPRVRVAYSAEAYEKTHPRSGSGGGGGVADESSSWVSVWRIAVGLWESRLRRLFTGDGFKEWVVRRRVRRWEAEGEANVEKGVDCLISEGQVLVYNGWAHV